MCSFQCGLVSNARSALTWRPTGCRSISPAKLFAEYVLCMPALLVARCVCCNVWPVCCRCQKQCRLGIHDGFDGRLGSGSENPSAFLNAWVCSGSEECWLWLTSTFRWTAAAEPSTAGPTRSACARSGASAAAGGLASAGCSASGPARRSSAPSQLTGRSDHTDPGARASACAVP